MKTLAKIIQLKLESKTIIYIGLKQNFLLLFNNCNLKIQFRNQIFKKINALRWKCLFENLILAAEQHFPYKIQLSNSRKTIKYETAAFSSCKTVAFNN